MSAIPSYKAMPASERLAAFTAQREAANLHQDHFAMRPFGGSQADKTAWRHMEACQREAAFIRRVARSCGDTWAA